MEDKSKPTDDSYDPHKHRKVKLPITNWEALINLVKSSVGTGVLAMPMAFYHSGYLLGSVMIFVIAFILVYSMHMLLNGMYTLCKRKRVPSMTYAEAFKASLQQGPPIFHCFAPCSAAFVNYFLAFFHFGICCVYIVFIAESIKQVVDHYLAVIDVRLHICFLIVPLILIFAVRNLKHLAPFSAFANVALLVGLGFVLYYVLRDLPPLSDRDAVQLSISRLPLYFGVVLFSILSAGLVIAIEEKMETPKKYLGLCGILSLGITIVTFIYAFVGFIGYWKYGPDIQGSITLNIPKDEVIPQIIKLLFAIGIYLSYSLQGYVIIDIIWNHNLMFRFDESKHLLYEMMFRAFVVLLTVACSVAVPYLGLILGLVGSLCLSVLGIIFPSILDLSVKYPDNYGPYNLILYKDLAIIVFGIAGGAVGSIITIDEIIKLH